eukprot:2393888-Amphidinium_carterae.2
MSTNIVGTVMRPRGHAESQLSAVEARVQKLRQKRAFSVPAKQSRAQDHDASVGSSQWQNRNSPHSLARECTHVSKHKQHIV